MPSPVPASKLTPPSPLAHWIRRPTVCRTLEAAARQGGPLLVTAPVGFGKTTTLAQWATQRRPRPAWVSLDATDDDPLLLLRSVVAAIGRQHPGFATGLLRDLDADLDVERVALPRLGHALEALPSPPLLVLSGADAIASDDARRVLKHLATTMGGTLHLVIDARTRAVLPCAALRAAGRLSEVTWTELAFDRDDVLALAHRLRDGGITRGAAAEVLAQTEGWPAIAYLAIRGAPTEGAVDWTSVTSHRHVAQYVATEVLGHPPCERALLRRVAVLHRWSPGLASAVADDPGAGGRLAARQPDDPLFVPVDPSGGWHRLHAPVREELIRELELREPAVLRDVHVRAGAWHATRGAADVAVTHLVAAGDDDALRDLLVRRWQELPRGGGAIRHALDALGDGAVIADPPLAVIAAWHLGLTDGAEPLARLLSVASAGSDAPAGFASAASATTLCRAVHGMGPLHEVRRWARQAAAHEVAGRTVWSDIARTASAWCELLDGAAEAAVRLLADPPARVAVHRSWGTDCLVAAIRSLALCACDRLDEAREAADTSLRLAGEHGGATRIFWSHRALGGVLAARGHGRPAIDALELALAQRGTMRRQLHDWPVIDLLLTLAPVCWREGQHHRAASAVAEARRLLAPEHDAGALPDRLRAIERQLASWSVTTSRLGLTPREIEVLRLVARGWTRDRAAAHLHLARSTVKTHLRSVYRKLEVTSRAEALHRAQLAGLVSMPT